MSSIIRPEGWHNWDKPLREQTASYAEYNSTGPGANPLERVSWSHQLTDEQAEQYTLEKVLSGDDMWNPLSGMFQLSQEVEEVTASESD
jgi:pectinesterase